ncbi:MAG: hypothetical protein EA385_05425 [Salinarimonadaceae bacterium]|nr:MAG: hypothetical protein EA385_05425 [Salinarimonadaceae bacterium]
MHEFFAAGPGEAQAVAGAGLALAIRAAGARAIVWITQDLVAAETGALHGAGLCAFGAAPERFVIVRAANHVAALQAAAEALRCPALGVVALELWGPSRALDLTASRRLALRAGRSGAPLLILRPGAAPAPSAAASRWSVSPAPSRPLEANAPGRPAFSLTLSRHRAGAPCRTWHLEWDRERASFDERATLSRPVVSLPSGAEASAGGSPPAGPAERRRAG